MKYKNNFKQGKIIEKFFVAKNGKKIEVIFHYPKMSDVDGLLKYINSLIEDGARIYFIKKIGRKDEIEYVKDTIKQLKKGLRIEIVIESEKKIVGKGDVGVGVGSAAHVATIGIAIMKEYRGLGIGKRLTKTLIKMAQKKWKIKVAKLTVCEDNEPAYKLYKKLGFRETGKIPRGMKYKNKYYNEILMCKRL